MSTLLKDRYELIRQLGQGGMGVVYEAHDNLLDRQVAVKLLSENSQSRLGSEGRARLLHEAQAAARLNHPNVVSMYDAGEDKGSFFLVMELIDGESLYDNKPQDLDEIISISRQVCAALSHAHQHGIIHRDLKPENIIVTSSGRAKLTDFGLARSLTTRLTMDGLIVGTVLYLAPEIALRQSYDGRSDLYSLGVILYELCTGCLPFSGEDPLGVISQHLYAPVVPPRAHRPEIFPDLEALILQLLSKRPEDRPASAADVVRILDALGKQLQSAVDKDAALREMPLLDRIVRGRMVGREGELAELNSAWRKTLTGAGQVLLISGEPGIGKTRLARELVAQAVVSSAKVLSGVCYSEGGMPYAPLPRLIQDTLEQPNFNIQIPELILSDLIKFVPALRSRFPESPAGLSSGVLSEQQNIFESVAALFTLMAAESPVLLFIDDAHWADSGTLSLLRHLARRGRELRLLILFTYREIELEENSPFQLLLNDLIRERLSHRIKLARFDRKQTDAMLVSLLTPRGEIEPALVKAIFLETEGNPFFIEEVCKTLFEEGKLTFVDGKWTAPGEDTVVIPQSVRVTLQTRLSRLPERTQDVLRVAAVIGREFDYATVKQACALEEEELIEALEIAERAQIITETGVRHSNLIFSFVHGLIPATLRENTSGLRRQRLHRSVASAIEILRPEDYETLAYQYEKGGDSDKAFLYTVRAADRALAIYANQEAARYYRSALQSTKGDTAPLLAGLGEALFRQTYYQQASDVWLQAAELYRENKDYDQLARLHARIARAAWYAGDPQHSLDICLKGLEVIPHYMELETSGVVTLLHETARAYRFTNQPDKAKPLCQHVLEIARRLDLVEVQAETLATLGILPNQPEEAARAALEEAVAISESAGLLVTAVRAHTNLGEHLRFMGLFSEARKEFQRGRELAQRIGIAAWEHDQLVAVTELSFDLGDFKAIDEALPILKRLQEEIPNPEYSRLLSRTIQARLHRFKGEWKEAVLQLNECLGLARQRGMTWMAAGINVNLGDLLLEMGNLEEAERVLNTDIGSIEDIQYIDQLIQIFTFAAVYMRQNRLKDAQQLMEKGRAMVKSQPTFSGQAYLHYAEGRLAVAEKRWEDAFRLFEELVQLTEQLNTRWYQARVYHEWAQAYHLRNLEGDSGQAIKLLRRALEIYSDLNLPQFMTLVEEKLQQLISQEDKSSRQEE